MTITIKTKQIKNKSKTNQKQIKNKSHKLTGRCRKHRYTRRGGKKGDPGWALRNPITGTKYRSKERKEYEAQEKEKLGKLGSVINLSEEAQEKERKNPYSVINLSEIKKIEGGPNAQEKKEDDSYKLGKLGSEANLSEEKGSVINLSEEEQEKKEPANPYSVINLSEIKKIEGPIYVGYLEPTKTLNKILTYQAPPILLLGDIHIGDTKCNPDCNTNYGCFSLYEKDDNVTLLKYLDEKASQTNVKFDFFSEFWFNEEEIINEIYKSTYSKRQNSAIKSLEKISLFCHPDRTTKEIINQCPYKNIRFHMSDPRQSNYKQRTNILEMLNNTATLEDFNTLCHYLYSKFDPIYILDLCKKYFRKEGYTILEFIEEPFYLEYSVSLKEYKKLPKEIQEIIVKNLKNPSLHYTLFENSGLVLASTTAGELSWLDLSDLATSPYDVSNTFFLNYHKKIQYLKSQSINTVVMLSRIDFNITVFTVDLYSICRLLKKPITKLGRNDTISSLSIVYLGNTHIQNIKLLLIDLYTINLEKTDDNKCIAFIKK